MSEDPYAQAQTLLALSPEQLERALAELVSQGGQAAAVLEELEAAAADKGVRKLVRRAVHQLKSRGVLVRERGDGTGASVLKPLEQAGEQALVSSVDPLGRQVVFLLRAVRGGAELFELALSDVDGPVSLRRHRGRRRDARSFVRSLRQDDKARVVDVSGAEARALIARAAATATVTGAAPRPGVDRDLLEELATGGSQTPGERLRAELELPEVGPAALDTRAAELLELGRLPPWPLVGEPLLELARELAGIDKSPLVLSEIQKRERRERAQSEAAASLFDPPTRERYARRLEESAVFLHADGEERDAAIVLAIAARVRDPENTPLQVGFLHRVLELSLEIASRQLSEAESGQLIVRS